MAEGAPLLREYGVYSLIEGSNPSCSAKTWVHNLLSLVVTPPKPCITRGFALLALNCAYGAGPEKPSQTPFVSKPHDFFGLGSEVGIFEFGWKSREQ